MNKWIYLFIALIAIVLIIVIWQANACSSGSGAFTLMDSFSPANINSVVDTGKVA
ncbi:MAG: hypothetical protein FWE45_05055 [Firmicutes bacterium]|nr:hypothetical protein [Bacillota bacterium]